MSDTSMKDLEFELECIKGEAEGMIKRMTELVHRNHRLRHTEKALAVECLTETVNEAFADLIIDAEDEIERRQEALRQRDLASDCRALEKEQY